MNSLPKSWADDLIARWQYHQATDYRAANVELRTTTESLLLVRIPLDASDSTLCEAAAILAKRCFSRAELYLNAADLRAAMARICLGHHITPPGDHHKDGPAIARMGCAQWWRRKLRKQHAQIVEASAIRIGRVNRSADLYVSEERFCARQQQNARNAETLESTLARNELGQEYTLAELAATSTVNKSNRRAELMTRISGFERIARHLDHAGEFITLTCPSRFHRWRTVNHGQKVIENPLYDPLETPATAQRHLAQVWACIRASLKRQDIAVYGFRIAEPQHDGTPHWHLLLFCEADHVQALRDTIRRHALKDSPDERGAAQHRCDFKSIDWAKGSAAGYIAKYVAKNIDGHQVGNDFNGKPATETAQRVEAWASTWGIRQFQQIGGAPVGVWRELRRIPALPGGVPAHLKQAHEAVNKMAQIDGHESACVAWDRYCMAQGGPTCGRAAAITLAMVQPEKLGRYGDEATPRPIGVETHSLETTPLETYPWVGAQRTVHWLVESTRHTWEIVRSPWKGAHGDVSIAEQATPAAPWTCVNNCTGSTKPNPQITAIASLAALAEKLHAKQKAMLELRLVPTILARE
ncbi:replication endonuclease [Curvibacter sp. HBC28]|uniref:Replication endonuclease n=1 Tax=Curvibacter microcysteis TaxID=3026419 RepID=A0ABT5MJ40_9BURK|nr:replication endonuclease [Curvibacter sp. HBC28]MDD0816426.1 replication endonuclease [Curvibacter sp. HBC28]